MNANNTSTLAPVPPATLTTEQWHTAIAQANTLHTQISDLTTQITTLEQKRWLTAVLLGALLTRMKDASGHGEWQKLFPKRNHDSQFNLRDSKKRTCALFSHASAKRYMKLYREVLRRAQTLGTINITPLTNGTLTLDDHTTAELTKLSDATTLRQAYLDFGIISPPPPKHLGFTTSGNPLGRHPNEKTLDEALATIGKDGEIMTARKLRARQDYASIISQIETFLKDGLHHEIPPSERSFFATSLTDLAHQILTEIH